METVVVRLFVADDVDGFEGTVQRPGEMIIAFHDAAELIGRLTEIVQARHRPRADNTHAATRAVEPALGSSGLP